MTKTLHILVAGRTLCHKPGVPAEWEPDHLWTTREHFAGLLDGELQGIQACAACRMAYEAATPQAPATGV